MWVSSSISRCDLIHPVGKCSTWRSEASQLNCRCLTTIRDTSASKVKGSPSHTSHFTIKENSSFYPQEIWHNLVRIVRDLNVHLRTMWSFVIWFENKKRILRFRVVVLRFSCLLNLSQNKSANFKSSTRDNHNLIFLDSFFLGKHTSVFAFRVCILLRLTINQHEY